MYLIIEISYHFYISQIEPSVMYDLLVSAYKMFRMFVGQLKDIPPEDIYDKCEQFFTPVSSIFFCRFFLLHMKTEECYKIDMPVYVFINLYLSVA